MVALTLDCMRARRSLLVASLCIIGCRAPEPARIGDAFPRDSAAGAFLQAVRPAIESTGVVIARWTVGDRPDRSTIQLNTEQATVFANDPSIVAVVGHNGSRDALLGAAVYNARGVPNVVPNATTRRLPDAGPWTFPMVPNDSIQGEFIADFALDSLEAKRVAVFYVGDEYGLGIRDGVATRLTLRGSELAGTTSIPHENCFLPKTFELFVPIIRAGLQRARPEAVVVTSGSDAGWCIASVIHATNPSMWIIFTDGMDGALSVPDSVSHVVPERIRGVAYWSASQDSASAAFAAWSQRTLHRPALSSNVLMFDAYMMLATAVREVGPDRAAIRKWLESLGRTREPWSGLTGPIAFNRPRREILRMSGPGGGPS